MKTVPFFSFAAVAGILLALGIAVPTPASADAPPSAILTPFNAPLCPGDTDDDPRNASAATSPFPDLTLVFGQRLDDYNAGLVVPLYDAFGSNDIQPFPAVCGVRYEGSVGGPVSEWLFCTDYFSSVCSRSDINGNLIGDHADSTGLPGYASLSGNPRLAHPTDSANNDKEKIISYLLKNGHYPVSGVGSFSWIPAGTTATQFGTSIQRAALQVVIWCITDYPTAIAPASEVDRKATCDTVLPASQQAEILAKVPDTPTITLDIQTPLTDLAVGDIAHVIIETNLYNQDITVTTTGISGTLSTDTPGAVLSGSILEVSGSDPSVSTFVNLYFTAAAEGDIEIAVRATPASISVLTWHQSAGNADEVCQVFSIFEDQRQKEVFDSTALHVTAPTTPTVPSRINTGISDEAAAAPALTLAGFGAVAVAGVVTLVMVRRRRLSNAQQSQTTRN